MQVAPASRLDCISAELPRNAKERFGSPDRRDATAHTDVACDASAHAVQHAVAVDQDELGSWAAGLACESAEESEHGIRFTKGKKPGDIYMGAKHVIHVDTGVVRISSGTHTEHQYA